MISPLQHSKNTVSPLIDQRNDFGASESKSAQEHATRYALVLETSSQFPSAHRAIARNISNHLVTSNN